MSLEIVRSGLLDTFQDSGRSGFQHLGVNPGGAMDTFSSRQANALLGKEGGAPVLEFHFPAPVIRFHRSTIISICGADFNALLDDVPVPLDHPVAVRNNAELRFSAMRSGARGYLSVWHELVLDRWMGSIATDTSIGGGGFGGRALRAGDEIPFSGNAPSFFMANNTVLHWTAHERVDTRTTLQFLIGPEWNWLTTDAQERFQDTWFQVSNTANRMGYHLAGNRLEAHNREQLVSSVVTFGTVQLLPDGQLVVLMADHGTTGGYPRIAQVVTAHLPLLAQKKPNDVLRFSLTRLSVAEEKMATQQKYLRQLQLASSYRMEEWLAAHAR